MSGTKTLRRIIFAGGGTAGHLMPAINISLEIIKLDSSLLPLFVGKKDGMEKDIVTGFGFDIREIEITGMKRNLLGILNFALRWGRGLKQASEIIKEFSPAAVVGTGGYVSAPVVRAAGKFEIPIFLQEQNSLPGLATRTLAKKARMIFTAYESVNKYLPKSNCRMTGNPIRPDLIGFSREKACLEFGLDSSKKTLLVMGGSSGARGINSQVSRIIEEGKIPGQWQILWQTGKKDHSMIRESIPDVRFSGGIFPFIRNMPGAYAAADLVLSRAGAMALAEITATGLPSVLIPYPHATGDHQTLNAAELEKEGACVVIREEEMGSKLAETLNKLFSDGSLRERMSQVSKKISRPEAARVIAKDIMEAINEV